MIIRKAAKDDIEAVVQIYDKIHTAEETGQTVIGWKRGIYPEKDTAEAALLRDDLFVLEDEGQVKGTGIINKIQVEEYKYGSWRYQALPEEVCVLHTLVIAPEEKGKGYGKKFVAFYEEYAMQIGCSYLRIDTNERNASARRLYKGLGYEEIGIIPCTFNGLENIQLVLLEKCLKKENR